MDMSLAIELPAADGFITHELFGVAMLPMQSVPPAARHPRSLRRHPRCPSYTSRAGDGR